jgi:hypothetical protein
MWQAPALKIQSLRIDSTGCWHERNKLSEAPSCLAPCVQSAASGLALASGCTHSRLLRPIVNHTPPSSTIHSHRR